VELVQYSTALCFDWQERRRSWSHVLRSHESEGAIVTNETVRFDVVEFGPTRGIGLAMLAKAGVSDFHGLWEKQLVPRKGEIARPEKGVAFGICRCVPGKTDGTFEYIALFEASAGAPVPDGMVAVHIPRANYAVFPAKSYSELGAIWKSVPTSLAANPKWEPYCGAKGCRCATHPSFEYYPHDPEHTGRALVYVPVMSA
jgi:predicted transcriptional regulator YdeE